jgi:hypothetical protein
MAAQSQECVLTCKRSPGPLGEKMLRLPVPPSQDLKTDLTGSPGVLPTKASEQRGQLGHRNKIKQKGNLGTQSQLNTKAREFKACLLWMWGGLTGTVHVSRAICFDTVVALGLRMPSMRMWPKVPVTWVLVSNLYRTSVQSIIKGQGRTLSRLDPSPMPLNLKTSDNWV